MEGRGRGRGRAGGGGRGARLFLLSLLCPLFFLLSLFLFFFFLLLFLSARSGAVRGASGSGGCRLAPSGSAFTGCAEAARGVVCVSPLFIITRATCLCSGSAQQQQQRARRAMGACAEGRRGGRSAAALPARGRLRPLVLRAAGRALLRQQKQSTGLGRAFRSSQGSTGRFQGLELSRGGCASALTAPVFFIIPV